MTAFFISAGKRRLSPLRRNRLNCHKVGTGWCVKDGEAGSGDFAKQNTTPYPLHSRQFLLTEKNNIVQSYYRHMEEKIRVPFLFSHSGKESLMKKETDMDEVKSIAKMLLMTDVHETKFSPMVVQHPFTSSGIVVLPEKDGKNFKPVDITQDAENLRAWRKAVSSAIDHTENPYELYMMVNKPYGLTFLKYTSPHLSKKDFSEILASAWIMCEAPHNDPDVSLGKLVAMFQSADPKILMDEDEYRGFQGLDDMLTVYRGVTAYNTENVKALSWTLNRQTAEWFANRFGEDGTVYEATIAKEHIYALFNGRNESEVIVDPKYLTDITEVQDMASDFILSQ